jgi:hypothetical protein
MTEPAVAGRTVVVNLSFNRLQVTGPQELRALTDGGRTAKVGVVRDRPRRAP